MQDAAHADIVVLSAHGRAKLPAPVRAWLEVWLESRDGSPCALVVSLDAKFQESIPANPVLNFASARLANGCRSLPAFRRYTISEVESIWIRIARRTTQRETNLGAG
jgi:hypothetical protein